jgi:hypothetical protein
MELCPEDVFLIRRDRVNQARLPRHVCAPELGKHIVALSSNNDAHTFSRANVLFVGS